MPANYGGGGRDISPTNEGARARPWQTRLSLCPCYPPLGEREAITHINLPSMGTQFSVISRKVCDCGQPITNKRFRRYCSDVCRNKANQKKYAPWRAEYQRRRQDEKSSEPKPDKVKCLLCGRYYVQVGTHIIQRHHITAREYRELNDLPLTRGIIPPHYRKLKREQTLASGVIQKNLIEKGESTRFNKGHTMPMNGWRGRASELPNLDQDVYPL